MKKFEETFEKLARHDDPNIIFSEWMDYVIDINLFTLHERNLDFKGREQDYFDMFNAWVNIQNDYLKNNPDKGWYDYLGLFYEDIVQSKYKARNRGQFFTPANVCQVMAEMTFVPDRDYSGRMINDCACGSGRLLLAGKTIAPNAIFIGNDLDMVAVKMCVLNFYIHGVRGAAICKNTLTDEFFGAYRVNNYLGYGLPLPHIEICDTEAEACQLFGITHDNAVEIENTIPANKILNPDDVEEIEVSFDAENGASGKIVYKDGQTTLM